MRTNIGLKNYQRPLEVQGKKVKLIVNNVFIASEYLLPQNISFFKPQKSRSFPPVEGHGAIFSNHRALGLAPTGWENFFE